jgi:hypothetical protein
MKKGRTPTSKYQYEKTPPPCSCSGCRGPCAPCASRHFVRDQHWSAVCAAAGVHRTADLRSRAADNRGAAGVLSCAGLLRATTSGGCLQPPRLWQALPAAPLSVSALSLARNRAASLVRGNKARDGFVPRFCYAARKKLCKKQRSRLLFKFRSAILAVSQRLCRHS